MAIFAVQYSYSAEAEQLAQIRPVHRDWLAGLFEVGMLLASGPWADMSGALLIFRADDMESLAKLLDQDPFDIAGFIGERVIEEWDPVYGPFQK